MEFKHRTHHSNSPQFIIQSDTIHEEKQAKLLHILFQLEKKGKLQSKDKQSLKIMILKNGYGTFSALESFEKHGDEDEFLDTLFICLHLQNDTIATASNLILASEKKLTEESYGVIVWIITFLGRRLGITFPDWAFPWRYRENVKNAISFLEESFGDVILFHIWEAFILFWLAKFIKRYQFTKKYLHWLAPVD